MTAIAVILVGMAGTQEIVRITLDTVPTPYESQRRIDLLEADEPRSIYLLKIAIRKAIHFDNVTFFYLRTQI